MKNTKFNRCHYDQTLKKKYFLEAKIMIQKAKPQPKNQKFASQKLRQKLKIESRNLNPDFDLTNFQSSNLPFDTTNR